MTESSLYTASNVEQCEDFVPYPMAPNKNDIGYYYRVTFPVGSNGLHFHFWLKNQWTKGGAFYIDGKELYNKPDPLYTTEYLELGPVTLNTGNHVLEGFGSGSGDNPG
jgi:hypothetical protein